jgi:hypothetical protein
VFRGSHVVRSGQLTAGQLRGPSWRRLFPDVYAPATAPVTHELRVRAALTLLPGAVVTGTSAAVLWGVELAGPDDDVDLTVPARSHPVRVTGLRVHRAHLPEQWRCRRRGLPTTVPEATTVTLAGSLPLEDAVVAVDRMVASGVVDLEPVRGLAAGLTGRGCRRARRACALADGLAASPQETRLRLLIGRSSLPPPVAQLRVLADGRFVARVDFAWPEQRVALEYDGLWHAEPGQFARDRARLNRLTAAGWRVVFVTAADLHHPEQVIARLAAALGR